MILSFLRGCQQMFRREVLMLDHKELAVVALLLQVYVVLEMVQEMLDPEIPVFLVLACLRLLR